MPNFGEHIAITFAVVLIAALLAGTITDFLRLPKVTGYLLVGVALGSSGLDLLVEQHVELLDPITKLAIGLVLFSLGCHFPLAYVRRILRRVLRLSAGELVTTFVLVSGGLILLEIFQPGSLMPGGENGWQVALLLGALALATAPATTILVLKESESEGPVTEYVDALVILNNVASIVVFELVFLAIHLTQTPLHTPMLEQIGLVSLDLFGSVFLGILAGLVVSFGCGLVSSDRWFVLLVAAATFLLGLAVTMGYPYMLGFLAMGLTVANTSANAPKIVAHLDRLTGFLCVVFFVVHGAELNLKAFVQAGLIGIIYIVTRSLGKYFGIRFAAKASGEPPAVRNWLGASLFAQAGAAIALAMVAHSRDPVIGKQLITIILGTVVFFEIIGPLLIRTAVLQAGEVPLARALHHTSSTPLDELRTLFTRIRMTVGLDSNTKSKPEELIVEDLVRKNVSGLNHSAGFDDVVAYIEQSHDNLYPIIDNDSALVGVIRYAALSDTMFDHTISALVRAADLASPVTRKLTLNDPALKAIELFRKTNDDCIPVVSEEEPQKYVGVVRRRDLIRYFVAKPTVS